MFMATRSRPWAPIIPVTRGDTDMHHARRQLQPIIGVLALVLLCVGCAHRTAPTPAPSVAAGFPPSFPTDFYTRVAPEARYRVDPARTRLTLKVYRTGALASLGHNHVITSGRTDGFIYLADDLAQARADLFVPVETLVVD